LEKAKESLDATEYDVSLTSDEEEAIKKAKEETPDAIILGYMEPRGSAFKLHSELREGWLTKNIPLLVVDINSDEHTRKGWRREEGMMMDAENYIAISGQDSIPVARLLDPIRIRERVNGRLKERVNTLSEAILNPDTFCVTWEQIPGRGALETQQGETIDNARKAAKSGKIHGMSVTDNPGGNPALSTEMLCSEIKKLGIEPLVHLASRDKNRNEIESMLHGLTAAQVRNLLILTGDFPANEGFGGKSKPVFDLDPIHVLQLIDKMNSGLEHEVQRRTRTLTPTEFFAGACVSPFKKTEAELMGQYYKLRKKIEAGAKFIITQVGYDARKFHEILQWLKVYGYDVPVLANIYILPLGTARLMNSNNIPGCVVTDKLVAELAEEAKADDKGRASRLLRAAKMYAIAKGMGFAGAHIGGHGATYKMVEYIIDKGEELLPHWQELVAEFDFPQENGFYFFERDTRTGLNNNNPAMRPLKPRKPLMYRFSRLAHKLLFNPKSIILKAFQRVAPRIDSSPRMKTGFGYFEHLAKVALFGCMNCGDCALTDVAYLCPMSQCPKNQRNAPCGGSYDGWCEVYPNEKKCIWVKAYERLKAYGEEDEIGAHIVPPCNWELFETPSWLNFALGRDHSSKSVGIKPPEKKTGSKKQ
jgi:methylenetetrahydrofolate reductase (NADPH)